jgi:hypothetical protein
MRRPHVFAALVTLAAAGCADPVTAPRHRPIDATSAIGVAVAPVNVPGTALRTLTIDGQQREFYVHVGRNAPSNAPVPVVFFFHGSGSNGFEHLQKSRWREKADTIGFIAIFPSALAYCFKEDANGDGDMLDRGELHASAKWTSGPLGGPTRPLCKPADYLKLTPNQRLATLHRFQDDTAFVDAMLADVKATTWSTQSASTWQASRTRRDGGVACSSSGATPSRPSPCTPAPWTFPSRPLPHAGSRSSSRWEHQRQRAAGDA